MLLTSRPAPPHRLTALVLASALSLASLALLASPAQAEPTPGSYSSAGAVQLGSPSTITVPDDMGTLASVAVTLSGLTHSDTTTLSATLSSPLGDVELVCGPDTLGGSASPSGATVQFSSHDEAAEPTCSTGAGLGWMVGTDAPTGTWTLLMNDSSDGRNQVLTSWSLALTGAPLVTNQPAQFEEVFFAGETITLTVAGKGVPTPTIAWQRSTDGGETWSDLVDQTAGSLTFPARKAETGYGYRAVLTGAGSVESEASFVYVTGEPRVTSQPVHRTVTAGTSTSFTAIAGGDPVPTVQWQESADGVSYEDIPGATATTYRVSTPSLERNKHRFRAVFENSEGSAASQVAQLTVNGTVPGAPTGLKASQTGTGKITLTWTAPSFKGSPASVTSYAPGYAGQNFGNGKSVAGSVTTASFTGLANGTYSASVAAVNAAGQSKRVFVTVVVSAPKVTPALRTSTGTLVSGSSAELTGSGPAKTTLTLQRKLAGSSTWTNLASVTTNAYGGFLTKVAPTKNASYRVRKSNGVVSNAVTITVRVQMTLKATRTTGRTYTLSGTAVPGVVGRVVGVAGSRNGAAYSSFANRSTNSAGTWPSFARTLTAGTWTLRATTAATTANAANTVYLKVVVS